MKKSLLIIPLSFLIGLGCKSSSKSSYSHSKENINSKSTKLKYDKDEQIEDVIRKAFERIISEQLEMKRIDKVYDTSKPPDSISGSYPLLSESETIISKKTDSKEKNNIEEKTNRSAKEGISTKEELKSKVNEGNIDIIEKNTQKEYVIFLKWVGGISIIVGVLSIAGYFLYRKLR